MVNGNLVRSVKTVKVCASFKTGPLGPIGSILQNACLEAMNVIEIIRRMPLCDFEAAMVVTSLYGPPTASTGRWFIVLRADENFTHVAHVEFSAHDRLVRSVTFPPWGQSVGE
jgi:hypothetical protein